MYKDEVKGGSYFRVVVTLGFSIVKDVDLFHVPIFGSHSSWLDSPIFVV